MQLRKEKLLIVHRRCCWLNREKKTDKTIVEMDEEVIRRIMDQYNEHLSYLHFYIPRLNMPLKVFLMSWKERVEKKKRKMLSNLRY